VTPAVPLEIVTNREAELNHSVWIVCVLLLFILVIHPDAFASDKPERQGIWGSIDIGIGHIERSIDGTELDDDNFFLGFSVGYALNSRFLLGVEFSGWLFDAADYNYPERGGEGLSQVFVTTHYYPVQEGAWFVTIGGGYVSHWNNLPDETRRKSGFGFKIGMGYDVLLQDQWTFTPFLTYSAGDADNQEHEAITIGAGFNWY